VYRRFNEFKTLKSKLSKKIPEAKKLFPSAKKFEGRKFEGVYVDERKAKLQKFLDGIVANKDLQDDKLLIKFLGLQEPDDPRMAEVFDLAFVNTKWRLWVWKRIPYDDEEQAISRLIIEEISREMYSNMLSSLPNVATVRSAAMSVLNKTITATVGPAVTLGWKAMREAVAPLKVKISEVIDNSIEKLLDAEDEVKKNLIQAIQEALNPICEQLNPVLKSLADRGVEPGMTLLKELYPYYHHLAGLFEIIIEKGDEKQVEEIEKYVKESRADVEAKVNDIIANSLKGALGDLAQHITLDALTNLFSPIRKLVELINIVFDLFLNPVPHIRCIQTMCEYRAKLEALSPSAPDFREQVEDILDQEESWLLWRRWWVYWDYRWKAWSIYYYSWGVPELSTVAHVFQDYSFQYAKVQKKWIKRWSFRFGDHLHERAKVATPETWKETVRECFGIGYKEANIFLRKKSFAIFTNLLRYFFYAAVGVKVQDVLMKVLTPVLEAVSKVIVAPLDEILDVTSITNDCIEEALMRQITSTVEDSMIEPYYSAWSQLTFTEK